MRSSSIVPFKSIFTIIFCKNLHNLCIWHESKIELNWLLHCLLKYILHEFNLMEQVKSVLHDLDFFCVKSREKLQVILFGIDRTISYINILLKSSKQTNLRILNPQYFVYFDWSTVGRDTLQFINWNHATFSNSL